ncbi:hypothetical protein [Streptomyces sp. ODS05-4]|uniref:hypothetical protein n=1 Tax=Streptomyces sp. ODS05-4 TaxID=2944939 RepID=UPI00210A9EF5|nr:hypothetical protein [Streptomyces sp. ODS05-4]
MTRRGRSGLIGTGVLLVLAGLGAFLAFQGLDRADKWASVLGLFVGVAGLALAVYGARAPGQSADGATAGGSVNQVRGVAGDVTIGAPRPAAPPPPAGSTPPPPAPAGGQSARGAWAGGSINQVDGVGGSARIGEDGTGTGAGAP